MKILVAVLLQQFNKGSDFAREELANQWAIGLKQGFPTWGTCIPRVTFAYPTGTFKVINRRAKYICI